MSESHNQPSKEAAIKLEMLRLSTSKLPDKQSLASQLFESLTRRKMAAVGLSIIFLVALVAILANYLTPHDPNKIDIINRLQSFGWRAADGSVHLLGTDTLGRDVFTRLIYGARISLSVGFMVVLIAGVLGVILGLITGYFGGVLDDIIMRIADIQLAFPFILLAISIMAVLGQGVWKLILVLGISRWMEYARIVRSQTLSLREKEFVTAAQSIGARRTRIIFRHILPNVWGPVIVIASFSMASTIIAEASLSYLGLGVPVDVPSWGGMLAESREYLEIFPWLSIFPGLAIALTVLGVNVVGDWMRDFLDPSLKNVVEK